MNPGSIQEAQIKVARTTSAKHKAFLALIAHTIKQTEAMHILRALTEIKVPTPVVEWYSSNLHEKARS
jgi:hypothetical protein